MALLMRPNLLPRPTGRRLKPSGYITGGWLLRKSGYHQLIDGKNPMISYIIYRVSTPSQIGGAGL